MAEILLSLTIIGVVAAITLPSLTGNINERTWNTQRKALYARFSQAISLMPALNGYGTLTGTIGEDGSQTITEDNVAETFITSGLSKVLKLNNICANENLADCGIVSSITDAQGNKITTPTKLSQLNPLNTRLNLYTNDPANSYKDYLDTKAAAFETQNGESLLAFYNPSCTAENGATAHKIPEKVCANFIYDLNGSKGPNTFGKDIGLITVFYPSDAVVVAPMPYLRGGDIEVNFSQANSACKELNNDYRAPNLEEMMALMYNKNLVNLGINKYWTNTRISSTLGWMVSNTNNAFGGGVGMTTYNEPMSVRCVQR
ncbi:MAG: type II secretion system GspH family protein [Fusobacterium sp.]|nr:type II secretion system GspH family protein [Fusobacterium sp.]